MPQYNLTETLQVLVRRHGMSSVLHSLADIQASPERPLSSSSTRRTRNAASKSSAVAYVARMNLPPDKAEIMSRAAQRFEAGEFLPTIADIREFCRIHSVELGKSSSRLSSVPRVFTFLAAMDPAKVIQVLEEGTFSGPTRLAPIADAIRSHSASRPRTLYPDFAQPASDAMTADRTKNR